MRFREIEMAIKWNSSILLETVCRDEAEARYEEEAHRGTYYLVYFPDSGVHFFDTSDGCWEWVGEGFQAHWAPKAEAAP